MKKFIVQPGKAELTSERLSEQIKNWEGSGIKRIMFLVPEWSEEIWADNQTKMASKTKQPIMIESLILSDFTMSSNMTGMVLYEQIYRGYRILNNHPYHK